jgi:hypothetical protein
MPSGVPLADIGPMMDEVRQHAREAGRDPNTLELLIWADVDVREHPAGDGRPDWVGTADEIKRDIEAARRLGATEIIIFPGFETDELSLERYFELMELMPRLVEGSFQAASQRELMPMTP